MESIKSDVTSSISSLDGTEQFSNVSLDVEQAKKKKVPRRIIHFSDGVLEEYSTDEEDEIPLPPPVDPKSLTWGPWFWHYASSAAFRAYGVADSCGERLAWFFGITSPKYQSAIDEFYRLKAQEEKEEEDMRKIGQIEADTDLNEVHVSQISPVSQISRVSPPSHTSPVSPLSYTASPSASPSALGDGQAGDGLREVQVSSVPQSQGGGDEYQPIEKY